MKGIIYQIYIDSHPDIHYVGSTTNKLNERWGHHMNAYETYLLDRSKIVSIYPYFEALGVENFKIKVIKEYDVIDRKHIIAYEQLWINRLKPVNKIKILYKTRNIIRTLDKIDYYNNRERHLEECKDYYDNNSEKIKARVRKYRENNIDKIKERRKKLYICPCNPNKELLKDHQSRHERSLKHQKYINSLEEKKE